MENVSVRAYTFAPLYGQAYRCMNKAKLSFQHIVRNYPRRHMLTAISVSAGIILTLSFMPGESAEATGHTTTSDTSAVAQKSSPAMESVTTVAVAETTTSADAQEQRLQLAPPPQKVVSLVSAPEPSTAKSTTKSKPTPAPEPPPEPISWVTSTVKSGDTLSGLFSRQKQSSVTLHRLLSTSEHGKLLSDLRPGQSIEMGMQDNQLKKLSFHRNTLETIEFVASNDGKRYTSSIVTHTPEVRTAHARATIKNSLFLAAAKAGLTDHMTMSLANIFQWDVDFVLDIRDGDSFDVIYEEKFLDGKKIGPGKILAATFTNQGKTYEAVYYDGSNGHQGYYTPDGKSMRKSFLRSPVEFTRISSPFNPNRLHPVFKTKRPHRGVDYAAPTGTPIKAAGDGVIEFSGWQNGYGNVVYIKHPHDIVTVYAHQSRLADFKKGQKVKQGDTIGYVGQTGWATGPHLHFEFQVKGVHRNPLTVTLPDAAPLPASEMAQFKTLTTTLLAAIQSNANTVLASVTEDDNDVSTQ